MGLRTIPVCDVFDTTKEVVEYRVRVDRVVKASTSDGTGVFAEDFMEMVIDKKVYLCPRGLDRFFKFHERSLAPPPRQRKSKPSDTEGTAPLFSGLPPPTEPVPILSPNTPDIAKQTRTPTWDQLGWTPSSEALG
jgi:hypothetical protein